MAARQAWQLIRAGKTAISHFQRLPSHEQDRLRGEMNAVQALVGELGSVTAQRVRGKSADARAGETSRDAKVVMTDLQAALATLSSTTAHELESAADSRTGRYAAKAVGFGARRMLGNSAPSGQPSDPRQRQEPEVSPAPPPHADAVASSAVVDELLKLAALRDRGLLEEHEFARAREGVLRSARPHGGGIDPLLEENLHALQACRPYDDGIRAEQRGDKDGACRKYREALLIGHPEVSADAAFNLGSLRLELGDPEEARWAWTAAMAFGSHDGSARSAFNLGNLRKREGDIAGAEAAYEFVITAGHEDAYKAASNLANIHLDRGNRAAARDVLFRAVGLGDAAAERELAELLIAFDEAARD